MQLELDHLFVLTAAGAPEAQRLLQCGLSEGTPNRHPGQGTANRRFFFHNAFLELLWVENAAEAQSEPARRLCLWERWTRRAQGASLFGICVRPVNAGAFTMPFPTWEYRPAYLPEPLVLLVATNSHRWTEPLLLGFPLVRPVSAPRQPSEHAAGLRAITRVRIHTPASEPASEELQSFIAGCPWLSLVTDAADLVEIAFDEERRGQAADLRPELPMVLRW